MPRLFSVLKEESLAPLLPPIAHRRADGTAPTWRLKHNSRARRMILRYHKGVATITLPRFATSSDVKKFLANSTDWLEKQISNEQLFHQQHALRHQQTISVMGRNLMLIFTSGRGRVAEKNNQLIVPCHQQKHQQKLKRYLWRRAEQEFPALLARQCAMLSLPTPNLSVRDPKSRWGSCINQKHFLYGDRARIMLSFRLTLAPPMVLAYLIAHEVAHLKEANHGPRFWQLVEDIYPDYATAERWLKTDGRNLMRLF